MLLLAQPPLLFYAWHMSEHVSWKIWVWLVRMVAVQLGAGSEEGQLFLPLRCCSFLLLAQPPLVLLENLVEATLCIPLCSPAHLIVVILTFFSAVPQVPREFKVLVYHA